MLRTKLLFFIIDFLRNTSIKKDLEFLQKSQWWSKVEIENYQNEKLRKIVRHAYKNVPYYNKLFNKLKLKPEDIRTKKDLQKLPILRRKDVARNLKDLLAVNANKYNPQKRKTGGTTGVPLVYYSDMNSWSLTWGLKFRAWSWTGYTLGEKIAILAGSSLIPNQKKKFKKFIWGKLNRMYPMSMTHTNNSMMHNYIRIIKKEKIHYLRGYPSSLSIFANFVKNQDIKLNIKAVITTAEVLQPAFRSSIESVFKCKVLDTYGCADAGANANECELHDGLHISHEPSIIEIIDFDNNKEVSPGEKGEIIATSLTNYAMPTLRYAPGDLAIKSAKECPCGRKMPLLDKIVGRTTDIIKFSNGIRLGGPAFTLIFRDFNIKKYQIIQNTLDSIDVNIVKKSNFDKSEFEEIIKILRYHTGKNVKINIHFVNRIKVSKSGKFRFIISNI